MVVTSMRILILGSLAKKSIARILEERCLADGHTPVLSSGRLGDENILRQQVAKIDVVIDTEVPSKRNSKNSRFILLRPLLMRKLLKASGKTLVVTSNVNVLGDTGSIPVEEDTQLSPPSDLLWLSDLEKQILDAKDVQGIVIRPAIEHYENLSVAMGNMIALALRFGEGKYIGNGTNVWSAVQPKDLADLYSRVIKKPKSGILLHASAEYFSMREVAETVRRGLMLPSECSSITLEEARKYSPVADRLIKNSAISGRCAKESFGWLPSGRSLLERVEYQASVARHEIGHVPEPCFRRN